jgi:Beta-fructosidases (levanase/invertase)
VFLRGKNYNILMNRQLKFSFSILALTLLVFSCKNKAHEISRFEAPSTYYQEQYRPQFHFSPEAHWMNDPNGLVYFNNEYHLFYQYYPDSTVWGPMHWGHAVSHDLIHWKHLPIALYPDSLGYIFSGSAVVDSTNTSGFGTDSIPPMVAIFTYHNPILEKSGSIRFQNQGVAYSIDKGRTWKKYSGNPVLKNPGKRDFRDPKMFWNEQMHKWELIIAVYDRVNIFSSPNSKDWTFESEFGKGAGAHGGVWECPDLFPLKIEGTDVTKWVMLVSINPGGPNKGSATQYFTGDFDGHKFIPDDINIKWLDWGRDDYAGVTWSNIPAGDGRKLFIGWMSNWNYASVVPTKVWRGAMTIPRELSLIRDNGQFFLASKPVREFGDLRIASDTASFKKLEFIGETEISSGKVQLMQSELFFGFNLSGARADTLGIVFENNLKERLVIGYSTIKKQFYIDRRSAGNSGFSNEFSGISTAPYIAEATLKLHILVDAASVEIFIDDGRMVMTTLVFPTQKYTSLKMFSRGGSTILNKAVFYGIDKIWR